MIQRFSSTAAALLLAATLAAPALAQDPVAPSGVYKMDPTHAMITWSVSHLGLSHYTARFNSFDIQLTLDSAAPANSRVSATVDALSVDTPFPGDKDFDAEVSSDARFLNAPAFPQITFASTAVEPTGPNTARITGDLTMLGQTHSETFEAVLNGAIPEHPFAKTPAVGFTATGVIDRTKYGMSFLAPQIVGAEVRIVIEAEFTKAD